MNFDRNRVGMVKRQYPVGTRIQLDSLCTNEQDMPSGLCGTVIGVDDQPALLMKWDNGKSLSLLPFEDSLPFALPLSGRSPSGSASRQR